MSVDEWRVERWEEALALEGLPYNDYWSDPSEEEDKVWNVAAGDFSRLEAYVRESGFEDALKRVMLEASLIGRTVRGTGLDLGAGVLWAEPLLFRYAPAVEFIYCVEYSPHRLLELGPKVLRHYGVTPDQVRLCLGSFENLKLEDASVDFVFMSASLHHADNPRGLLSEVARVLRPDGVVLMIGEDEIVTPSFSSFAWRVGRTVRAFLGRRLQVRWFGSSIDFSQATRDWASPHEERDDEMGDHHYTKEEYERMFLNSGLKPHWCRWCVSGGAVLIPLERAVMAGK